MLTIFGSIAVAIMFLSYWLESRSRWNILIFAVASAATSAYSGLEEVDPIMVIEGLWSLWPCNASSTCPALSGLKRSESYVARLAGSPAGCSITKILGVPKRLNHPARKW
jgi:hypothetical protein